MTDPPDDFVMRAGALLEAVVRDALSAPALWILVLSVLGVMSGLLAFRRTPNSVAPPTKHSWTRTALYWASLTPSLAWYVFPFLPQKRFPSLLEGASQGAAWPLTIGLAGAIAFLWYGVRALRVVRENGTATGKAMADFLRPSHLLTEGAYARVRHPMFLFDFLAHTGLAVAAGALTTVMLLPVYFLLSATFNLIEERWVLRPQFGEAYRRYRANVPGYMTPESAVVLCLLVLGTGSVLLR